MRRAEMTVSKHKAIEEQSLQDYEFMVEQIQVYLSSYLDNHLELTPYMVQNNATEKLKSELFSVK